MAKYLLGYKSTRSTPRHLRQLLGVSNVRMAQLLGVGDNTWLAWQSGRRKPSAAAVRLMDVIMWLFDEGQLSNYWWDCAEPKILRNYDYEDERPEQLRRD
jgi:transcriptional regulator with XRE-family HTH domain